MDILHRIRCDFGGVSGAARRRGFGEDREGPGGTDLFSSGPNATGRPRLRRLRRFCRLRRKPSGMRPARRAGPTGRNRPPGGPDGRAHHRILRWTFAEYQQLLFVEFGEGTGQSVPARPPLGAPAGRGRPPGGPKGAVCPCPLPGGRALRARRCHPHFPTLIR